MSVANCITGFSISNWLTLGFSFAPRDIAWRFPLAFQLFFTFCIYAMCPFLPDSPRLLIRKGKHDEALEVLAALEGHGATPESASVITQYNIIKDILDREQTVLDLDQLALAERENWVWAGASSLPPAQSTISYLLAWHTSSSSDMDVAKL